ncbi:glycosyltransferase [Acetobacterium wieringae]|uniref:glycosyltransferase n=1 Tax=Acetobacterium wieringae TaxID=52694 RepID=UPI0026EA9F7D|nr:glycosyltransferase [Acetobacterium wieringae]
MKVTIIIPIYNAEKYLKQCVDSILCQEYQDFELLLVDDGSTDKSGVICDNYVTKNNKVRCFHLKNGGPSKARNFGITQAKGEFIQFVDADDSITEDCGNIFFEIASRSNIDLVIANADIVTGDNKLIKKLSLGRQGIFDTKLLLENMNSIDKDQFLHYIWNKWYRRQIIVDNGLAFNERVRLGEDFLFNCAFFSASDKIALMNKIVYYYYKRDAISLTGKFREKEIERRRLMDSTFIQLLKEKKVYDQNKQVYDATIGEICLQSMESVTKRSCTLSLNGKKRFIDEFLDSEYYTYLMEMRKIGEIKITTQLVLKLIKEKWCYALLFSFWLKAKLRVVKFIIF